MSKSSIFCFFMMYQRLLKESFIPCVTGYIIWNKKDRSKVHCIQVGLVISIYKITITVYIHILFLILPICRVRMYYFIECSFYISNLKSIYVFFMKFSLYFLACRVFYDQRQICYTTGDGIYNYWLAIESSYNTQCSKANLWSMSLRFDHLDERELLDAS